MVAALTACARCEAPNYHTDYWPPVGTDALTLITPLRDFAETDSFQLVYRARPPPPQNGDGAAAGGAGGAATEERRYAYQKGRAIVFGSRFEHSTEVGAGRDGEAHAYLCFTFGTDQAHRWPEISRTLGTQTRVVKHPDGELRLSHLGEEIERMVQEYAAQQQQQQQPQQQAA